MHNSVCRKCEYTKVSVYYALGAEVTWFQKNIQDV